eukprot:g12112.t1
MRDARFSAVRLVADSPDAERDASAEEVAASLTVQGFCLIDAGFKQKEKQAVLLAVRDEAKALEQDFYRPEEPRTRSKARAHGARGESRPRKF